MRHESDAQAARAEMAAAQPEPETMRIFRLTLQHQGLPHRHLCAGAHKPTSDHARLCPRTLLIPLKRGLLPV